MTLFVETASSSSSSVSPSLRGRAPCAEKPAVLPRHSVSSHGAGGAGLLGREHGLSRPFTVSLSAIDIQV